LLRKEEIMGNMPVVTINTTLFWQMINFLILVWIFKRFFFKPLSKVIKERKEEITADIDNAKQDKEIAQELKSQAEKGIKEAKSEAQKIITEAVKKAEDAKEEIVKEAHAQREKMMKSAEADILKMKENAKKELRDEMTEIAVKLAEKMVEKELSADISKSGQLLDKFIEEVGEVK
jgi:F-type H+-transporting ATPase subunit b